MSNPKVFVGTMYCGEGDFDLSTVSIATQVGVDVERLVISNLPEKEAHNALWAAWRERQSSFDCFLKVDADTVLAHPNVIASYIELLKNPDITGIQAPLADYFTDDLINGLNCFSPKVTFRDTADDLFCDRHVDVDHNVVIASHEVPNVLRPAGLHCHYTKDIQAFHFGVHRALKGQASVIEKVRRAWTKHKDRQRGLAILGARSAAQFSKTRRFNYNDKELIDAFDRALSTYESMRP